MKKATQIIAGAVLGVLLMAGYASAAIHGEIGLKGTGLDNTQTQVHRLREYSALPVDGSLSLFNLDKQLFHKRGLFQFRGRSLGEDDADATVLLTLGKWLTLDESYSKIQHNMEASGFETQRAQDSLTVRLLPLSKLNAFANISTDDKMGKLDEELPIGRIIGQKTEKVSGGVNATLWNLNFSGSGSREELSDRNSWSNQADGIELALSLRPRSSFWGIVSYDKKEYTKNWNSAATNTVELEKTSLAAQYVLSSKLTLNGAFSENKRSNNRSADTMNRARARGYEDSVMSAGVNFKTKCGTASLSYKTSDRDLQGTGLVINNRQTDTFKVKVSTKWSFLGIKAGYTHSNRDISGFTAPAAAWSGGSSKVWNYEYMSGETSENTLAVTLLGFKYFNLVASNNAKRRTFNANEKYGVQSINSLNRGLTANYQMNEEISLNLGAYSLKNRTLARESFMYGTVLPDLDLTTSVNTGTNYLQLGAAFQLDKRTSLSADLTNARSSIVDFQQGNSVKERTVSVSLDKQLSKSYSATAEVVRNTYIDAGDSSYSPKNTLFTLELKKKF